MSLETSVSKAVFQGNGVTVDFPFSFRVWEARELSVMVTGPDGVNRDVTGQCVISLSDSGGTVTYAPEGGPLPAGAALVILRNMPFLQEIRLINGTRFDPAVIEEALDRATAERQQLLEKVNRAIVVPAGAVDPPEELAEQIFEARDRAEAAAGKASASQTGAGKEADRAKNEANRASREADRAAQAATLGVSAANLEAVWTLESDVPAGGTLDLPVTYFPGRNMLQLGYDGVEMYQGPQYAEIGNPGEDVRSSAVRMRMPLAAGTVLRAWVVASNVARHVEEARDAAEAAVCKARDESDRATEAAERAKSQASSASASQTGAEKEADRAENEANRAFREADRAKDEAERAAGIAKLGTSVNLEATWALPNEIPAGGLLTLPDGLVYWPGRSMLRLSHDGVAMYPGAQFAEVDEGRETSGTVRVFLRLKAGAVVNAWIVASNVAKASEEAIQAARDAAVAREAAQNAAVSAGEDAELADDAAIDAGKYRDEAQEAAKRAAASVQGRSLAAVLEEGLLADAPSGFYLIDPHIVVPATIQHPLTPVSTVADIPNADGFYLVVPPFTDRPPGPEAPNEPGGNHPWILPCGKRVKI